VWESLLQVFLVGVRRSLLICAGLFTHEACKHRIHTFKEIRNILPPVLQLTATDTAPHLQHTATHYNTPAQTERARITLSTQCQHTTIHCNILQHTTTHLLKQSGLAARRAEVFLLLFLLLIQIRHICVIIIVLLLTALLLLVALIRRLFFLPLNFLFENLQQLLVEFVCLRDQLH